MEQHYKTITDYGEVVYSSFLKEAYGVTRTMSDFDVIRRKVRYYKKELEELLDPDAFSQVNILYNTDFNVEYENELPGSSFSIEGGIGSIIYKDRSSMKKSTQTFKINYITENRIVHNVIDINTNGNITRINLNPSGSTGDVNPETHVHVQNSPSDVWNVNHMLGKIPDVTIEDSEGVVINGVIDHIDTNVLQIHFSSPVIGKAYVK